MKFTEWTRLLIGLLLLYASVGLVSEGTETGISQQAG